MNIEEQTKHIVAIGKEIGDKISLSVAIESQQRFLEYLEWLEVQPLTTDTSVTVRVDGETIRFDDTEDFSSWITSNK